MEREKHVEEQEGEWAWEDETEYMEHLNETVRAQMTEEQLAGEEIDRKAMNECPAEEQGQIEEDEQSLGRETDDMLSNMQIPQPQISTLGMEEVEWQD